MRRVLLKNPSRRNLFLRNIKMPPAGRSAFNRRDHFYVSEKKLLFLFLFSTFIPIFYLYLLLLICDSFSKKRITNHTIKKRFRIWGLDPPSSDNLTLSSRRGEEVSQSP